MVENGREGWPWTRSGEGDVRDRNDLLRRQTAVHTERHTVERVGVVVVVLRGVAWRVVLRLTHALPAQEAASGESVRGEL